MRARQGTPVRGWERRVNPGALGLSGGLGGVFFASSFRLYARGDGGALTLGDESGLGTKMPPALLTGS